MDLLSEAIWILQQNVMRQDVLGAFSGGKDSIAVKRVCELANIRVEWHYHNTTCDPPELIRFIRTNHQDVIWDKPKHGNIFHRIVEKGVLPSHKRRWCCDEYKESRGPLNTVWIVGTRREESPSRAAQPIIGLHKRTRRVLIRPLANWDSEFLWDFIRAEKLPYPSLYDEGFHRLGCVGCPLATRQNREKEMTRWPKIGQKWKDAARKVYEQKAPWDNFKSFDEFFDCWMSRKF